MNKSKKISIMIILILFIQIMLPMINVVFVNRLTLFSFAENENQWDISKNADGTVIATFDEQTGVLTISGTGQMIDYTSQSDRPWNDLKDSIKTVNILDGVTSIGDYAFSDCSNLTDVEITMGVTSIGESAFYRCKNLTNIEIPNSVIDIEDYAFHSCESITNIKIPNGVSRIGYREFYGCKNLTNIELPNSVTRIGIEAFCGCINLASIEIPNSVTSIYRYAFQGCENLRSIVIPDSITFIEGNLFSGCASLTQIIVDENNNNYSSMDGVLFNKNKDRIICYPKGKTGKEYNIPSNVVWIGERAFFGCGDLINIAIPDSVTSIGKSAFSGCKDLTNIVIPNGVTVINNETFSACENLINITIPNSVTSIGDWAFSGCKKITSIEIPNGITSIAYAEFYNCTNLTSIIIPNSVSNIHNRAFEGCTNLTIYTNSEYVNNYANENEIPCILDNEEPTIVGIVKSTGKCVGTNGTVTLTIEGASDGEGVGLADKPYSFDNGQSWQSENTKTYNQNTNEIIVKIKDRFENVKTCESVNVNNIKNHSWNNGQVTKEASCTEVGTKTFTCTTCGEIRQETIAMIPHNYVNGRCAMCGEAESEIYVESKYYEIGNEIIKGVLQKTTIEDFKNNKIEVTQGATVRVEDKNGNTITDASKKIGTGMKLVVEKGEDRLEYVIIVTGDLTGNGEMRDADLLKLARYRAGLDNSLEGPYLEASDVYKDGIPADNKDILKMARILVGLDSF